MNQILTCETVESGRRILLNNVKRMCIFFMLFGGILLGEGCLNLYTNLSTVANVEKPIVIGHQSGGKTIFDINSSIGVKKIIYAWANGEETILDQNDQNFTSFEIENRIGENDLILKIIDSEGNTITYNNIKIVYDQQEVPPPVEDPTSGLVTDEDWQKAIENDKSAPLVTLGAEKGKVVIMAVDDIKMSYVIYKWNEDGEETKITGLSEDEKSLNARIDAMKGDNKLFIKAYDFAGNVKEMDKDVHGTDGPKITVNREDDKIKVNVTDDYGITKIEYNFNGEETTVENIEGTSYNFDLDLVDGDNYIIINAFEGSVKTEYKGKTKK